MAWLITGGAGYIGAHVVEQMRAGGQDVVVLDDLSTGRAERLPVDVPLITGAVSDRAAIRRALHVPGHEVTGVMHFAARKQVGESVARPLYYWSENVGGLQVLLEEMSGAGITHMVFSSSAAVYGQPSGLHGAQARIGESTPGQPMNPYGATKLAGEWMVAQTARANGWRALSLRYFNVAGAATPRLGDTSAANLIPMVFTALAQGRRPKVFGADYPTPDGTCIRDYIHVADLAAAHVAAARVVETTPSGTGVSVRSAGERVHQAAALAEQAAAEVANQAAAKARESLPAAARAVELAAMKLPGAARAATTTHAMRGQASELVTEVASQVGSIVARVAGLDDGPQLVDHLAVNIGTGRGYSVFEVMEALRSSVGTQFPVDIVGRRPGDPAALVAAPDLAGRLLGWRATRDLTAMTDSAWAAWQAQHEAP